MTSSAPGIYVLIGLVAAAVGGAFWIAFAVGVSIAAITGIGVRRAGHEVPPGRGRLALRQQGLRQQALTFLVTVSFLSASFAAAGSLATGFSSYFAELWAGPPALLVTPALHRRC